MNEPQKYHPPKVPSPKSPGADAVGKIPCSQFTSDAVAYFMLPHNGDDAQRKPTKNEKYQQEIHRLFAVAGRSDHVDFPGNVVEDNNAINAQRDNREEEELQQPTIST